MVTWLNSLENTAPVPSLTSLNFSRYGSVYAVSPFWMPSLDGLLVSPFGKNHHYPCYLSKLIQLRCHLLYEAHSDDSHSDWHCFSSNSWGTFLAGLFGVRLLLLYIVPFTIYVYNGILFIFTMQKPALKFLKGLMVLIFRLEGKIMKKHELWIKTVISVTFWLTSCMTLGKLPNFSKL